jgi:hypothetical protein
MRQYPVGELEATAAWNLDMPQLDVLSAIGSNADEYFR